MSHFFSALLSHLIRFVVGYCCSVDMKVLSSFTATTENVESTTLVEATTTVFQQTSTDDGGTTTVADETTTVTDAMQTQTGRYYTVVFIILII